jgi:two-component system response regulator RegA
MRPHSKFLVVDDDAAFRTRLIKALVTRGYESQGAGNVDEAVDVARDFKPDAAVVDLRMPGGRSGLDLVPELVRRHPGIQIVILTGYGSIATAVEAVRQGAINYLSKPSDADQILAAFDSEADGNGGGGAHAAEAVETTPSLARVEYEHIQRILSDCGGNISLAARKLGIHRRSLQRKLSKLPPLE